MIRGIAILGLNGAGKSTVAHALAKALHCAEMDAEDYYFPEQSESRRNALEGIVDGSIRTLGEKPFSVSRTKDEAQAMLLRDISAHPRFVLSGVTMNWCEEIRSRIDIAFWIQAPLEIRLQRIRDRERRRFGDRVLPGGDMAEQQIQFCEMAARRDPQVVEQSIRELHCPARELDGTLPIEENVAAIVKWIQDN